MAVLLAATAVPPSPLAAQSDPLAVNRAVGSVKFLVEPLPGTAFVRLRTASGTYLHSESGALDSGNVPVGYWTSQWQVEPVAGTAAHRLRNRFRNDYLHAELATSCTGGATSGSRCTARSTLSTGPLQPSAWGAMWLRETGQVRPRSVKFLATADPQYENDPAANEGRQSKRDITDSTMSWLRRDLGARRGLVIAGDLTQNTRKDEWEAYLASLGTRAADVYDGLGNHDMVSGNCCVGLAHSGYCTCTERVAGELANRKRTTPSTGREGNHYSWDWDDVHFVQLNLYVGDSPSRAGSDPANSLAFLRRDLAAHVGGSGRPVVLVHHYSMDGFSVAKVQAEPNPWWTERELAAYWDAIAAYNVVAIVTGHLHSSGDAKRPDAFWLRHWGQPPAARRIRTSGIQRPTERSSRDPEFSGWMNPMPAQTVDSIAARWRAPTPNTDSLERYLVYDHIPTFPAAYDVGPTGLARMDRLGLSERLKWSAITAMRPTIPVFVAGATLAGLWIDFEVNDTALVATRYTMAKDWTPLELERVALPLRPRAPAGPTFATTWPRPPLIATTSKGPVAGGYSGLPFSDTCAQIAQVRVRAASTVRGVQLVCRDTLGVLTTRRWRGDSAGTLYTFALQPGEQLRALRGTHGSTAGAFLHSLQVVTDKRASPIYGTSGQDAARRPFELMASGWGAVVVGVHGSATTTLTSIGFVTGQPVATTASAAPAPPVAAPRPAVTPVSAPAPAAITPPPGTMNSFQSFALQAGTALHATDQQWAFASGDVDGDRKPDLVAIRQQSPQGKLEVHVLGGASRFARFDLQVGTALGANDGTWAYTMADVDGDRRADLVAVKKTQTGSGKTEVHVLSAASGFQRFIVQTATALGPTDGTWRFAAGDVDADGKADLVAIKRWQTGTNRTEVHILSGASGFTRFSVQAGTPLELTATVLEYQMADVDGDGRADLVGIKKQQTGTGRTEVHVLSAASGFQRFVVQTGTALPLAGPEFAFVVMDWDGDGSPEVTAIKKSGTGTGMTEVHLLRR